MIETIMWSLLFLNIFQFIVFKVFSEMFNDHRKSAIKRGYAQHNAETGKWEWK